jgi:hypothetical protein
MEWYAIAIICILAFSSGVSIASVGKPKEPTTAGVALTALLVHGLMIWGIVSLANG